MMRVTVSAILIILIASIFSCDSPTEPDYMENVTYKNQTSYQINISITSDIIKTDTKSFSIPANGQKTIKAEFGIVPIFEATVEGNSHLQVHSYESGSSVTIAKVYTYEIEYKITGTASSVDVTLSNASGGTEQFSNVALPKTYSYKNFYDNFVYISAQNQGSSGSVTVTIFHRGSQYRTSTSSGAYVIATASGSI